MKSFKKLLAGLMAGVMAATTLIMPSSAAALESVTIDITKLTLDMEKAPEIAESEDYTAGTIVVKKDNTTFSIGKDNKVVAGDYTVEFDLTAKTGKEFSGIDATSKVKADGYTVTTATVGDATPDSGASDKLTVKLSATVAAASTGEDDDDEDVDINSDKVVWVGGKDVRNKTDATKSVYYKTESYQHYGLYAGGKWTPVVTTTTVDKAAFIGLFTNGKFNTKDTAIDGAKNIAKAKIKDGLVTVTAGKTAGKVRVWIAEVNNKRLVTSTASTADNVNAFAEYKIDPQYVDFEVKQGSSAIALTSTEIKAENGVFAKVTDVVKKCELEKGKSETFYIADSKVAISADNTFTISQTDKDKTYVTYDYDETTQKLIVTAKDNKDGKKVSAKVTIINDQTGKKMSFSVTVKASTESSSTSDDIAKVDLSGLTVLKPGDNAELTIAAVENSYTGVATVKDAEDKDVTGKLVAGTKYNVSIVLTAAKDKKFASTVEATLPDEYKNVKAATSKTTNDGDTLTITAEITPVAASSTDTKITKVGLTLADLAVGNTAIPSISKTTSTDKYSVGTPESDKEIGADDKAVAAGQYVITVTLTAETGYTFEDITASAVTITTGTGYTTAVKAGTTPGKTLVLTLTTTVA